MAYKKNIVHADNFTAQRKMDIKKGDTVAVIAGKDKGKRGTVIDVRPRENRVIVENVNMVVKHEKARGPQRKGGRIEKPGPMDRSNVMLVDPATNLPTRVHHKIVDGKNVRVGKGGSEIATPEMDTKK